MGNNSFVPKLIKQITTTKQQQTNKQKSTRIKDFIIFRDLTLTSAQQYEGMQQILSHILKIPALRQMTNLIDVQFQKITNLCGTTYKIRCFYEQIQVKLSQQINIRKQQSQAFEEIDLLNIIMTCSSIINTYCQLTNQILKQKLDSNKLSKQNCNVLKNMFTFLYISSQSINILEDGSIILLNPLFHQINNQITYYCSPQKLMLNQHLHNTQHTHKSLVFQLGLTILQAALLQSVSCLYNVSSEFNEKKLKELIQKLKENKNYSLLSQLLIKMLQISPQIRITMKQVQNTTSEILDCQSYHKQYLSNINLVVNNQSPFNFFQPNSNREIIQIVDKKQKTEKQFQLSTQKDFILQPKNQNIFTDPILLKMIKQELNNIQNRKSNNFKTTNLQNQIHKSNNKENYAPIQTHKTIPFEYQFITNNHHLQSFKPKVSNQGSFIKKNKTKQVKKDGTLCQINYPPNLYHHSTNNKQNYQKHQIQSQSSNQFAEKYCDKSKLKNYSINLESKRSSGGSLIDSLMSHQMYF